MNHAVAQHTKVLRLQFARVNKDMERRGKKGKGDSHSRACGAALHVQLAFCFLHLESQSVAGKQHTLHLWPVHHIVSCYVSYMSCEVCHVRSSSSTGVPALKPCLICMYIYIYIYLYIHIHIYVYIYTSTSFQANRTCLLKHLLLPSLCVQYCIRCFSEAGV